MASCHLCRFKAVVPALALTACASHVSLDPIDPDLYQAGLQLIAHAPAPAAPVAAQIQVARYTTLLSEPTAAQVEPLQSSVHITFPREVQTIGQALDYVLLRTGYSLGSATSAAQERFRSLSLPESQRELGPYSVDEVLKAILGDEWQLVTNHLQRVVSFVEPPVPMVRTSALTAKVQP